MTHYKQMELNLMSSQEDFRAKTYQLQENKKESSENDHLFGRSMQGSSKMYGRSGRLLKMYQPFDLKDLHWSYKISARSGIMQNGIAYPVPQLVGYTEEIAYGSSLTRWPTPTQDMVTMRKKKYAQGEKPLTLAVAEKEEEERKLWRTPTTMDSKEDALKHATKLLQGKTQRKTGETIQITLADQVMIEEIQKNPQLMEHYKDHLMVTRPNLPPQQDFVEYLRNQTTAKELAQKTGIKKTTVEHWFRRDKPGFSHPTIEDWEKIKPHLQEVKYDQEMTKLEEIEWQPKRKLWATPTTQEVEHPNAELTESGRRKTKDGKDSHSLGLADQVQLFPTPCARDWKGASSVQTIVDKMSKGLRAHMGQLPNRVALEESLNLLSQEDNLSDTPTMPKPNGQLNPTWVEWLMGYPEGWTDCED